MLSPDARGAKQRTARGPPQTCWICQCTGFSRSLGAAWSYLKIYVDWLVMQRERFERALLSFLFCSCAAQWIWDRLFSFLVFFLFIFFSSFPPPPPFISFLAKDWNLLGKNAHLLCACVVPKQYGHSWDILMIQCRKQPFSETLISEKSLCFFKADILFAMVSDWKCQQKQITVKNMNEYPFIYSSGVNAASPQEKNVRIHWLFS